MMEMGLDLLKRIFQRRYGIAVRKVGVRSEVRWYWHAAMWIGLLAISAAIAVWMYDAGRRFAGFDRFASEREVSDLRERVATLELQLANSNESARAGEAKLQVEVAASEQIASQLRYVQRENLALKEELALFEGLVSGASPVGAVLKVPKAMLESIGRGKYRYRMLVVYQSNQKNVREFSGDFRFELKVRVDGRDVMIAVPGDGTSATPSYRIAVKHIYRAEGEFAVPEHGTVTGGEVILSQDGNVKLRHPISL